MTTMLPSAGVRIHLAPCKCISNPPGFPSSCQCVQSGPHGVKVTLAVDPASTPPPPSMMVLVYVPSSESAEAGLAQPIPAAMSPLTTATAAAVGMTLISNPRSRIPSPLPSRATSKMLTNSQHADPFY
jgi:hypothetical protein